MNNITVIELFAGAGGLSLGMRQAGLDVKYAYDINSSAVYTYNANIGHARVADVRELTGQAILDDAGIDAIDVVSGGPPCQGFSSQRKGAHVVQDKRNNLVIEYARIVSELRPKAFVFENVTVFGQKRGILFMDDLERRLNDYCVHKYFVDTSDFGMAQSRKRFVMIGVRSDISTKKPQLLFSPKKTVRDVIGDLPPPPEDFTEHPDYFNHMLTRASALNIERFKHVPQGGGWHDIPFDLRLDCHKRMTECNGGGWADVYGRLEWDGQCPTITTGFNSFSKGRYGHPEQHRALTFREGARLQGFPDDFRFYGTRNDMCLQIGNAVPPPLGRTIAAALKKVLECPDLNYPDTKEKAADKIITW